MSPRKIKVSMLKMKKANYPDTLWSGGVNTCIAIGFYNPDQRNGYMLHHPDMHHFDLEGAIGRIQQNYGTLSKLKVFVTGNSLTSDDDEDQRRYELEDRPYVEKTLAKYFQEKQLEIQWLPDDYWAELSLDTSTGEFRFEKGSLDEMVD